MLAEDVLQESLLKLCDLAGLHLVQVTSDTSVDDCYLLLNGHGSWRDKRETAQLFNFPLKKKKKRAFSLVFLLYY